MESKLYTLSETATFINKGYLLSLAGDESILAQLPKGSWIGGTIPYFMNSEKPSFSNDKVYVNKLSDSIIDFNIKVYNDSSIYNIVEDSFSNGFTILILPPFQAVQRVYALESPNIKGIYNNPIIGWISGKGIGSSTIPKVLNGQNMQVYEDKAVAMHVKLPVNKTAELDVINVYEEDLSKPTITFLNSGVDIHDCMINEKKENLYNYIRKNNIDVRLPLMSNHNGVIVNVSIQEVDKDFNIISFYAPVFNDREYFFSKQVDEKDSDLNFNTKKINSHTELSFLCVLNYIYLELVNNTIHKIKGPFTFGEIGYHLLNQTIVSLKILDKKSDE